MIFRDLKRGNISCKFISMPVAVQGEKSLNVEVGKSKGDPVVMGLLKSTMFPLQQVLEGTVVCHDFFEFSHPKCQYSHE